MGHHVRAGNRTRVLSKSKCSTTELPESVQLSLSQFCSRGSHTLPVLDGAESPKQQRDSQVTACVGTSKDLFQIHTNQAEKESLTSTG